MFASSWLFVPGDRPDRFGKACSSGAGAVILDLEDAVAPASKAEARAAVRKFLDLPRDASRPAIAVRMNPVSTLAGLHDLAMLVELGDRLDYLIVPKAEEAAELALIGKMLAPTIDHPSIIALIESGRGVAMASQLAVASPQMAALMFGAADYAADLGKSVARYRPDFARTTIVNAAAAGGIAALDSPWFDTKDASGLAEECAASMALGFHAKAAIHPSQIDEINRAFSVSDADRDLARRYIAASVEGVALVDGKMVDVAMLNWARRIA
ncbi:Citrate lyase [Sphingobium herbicidovorans NBRC 16415]|uniref:Citrate lyase n=1 Tax=Sphingobium herbicidovorans (strain ATCC 700291 / DSM 11019 / CCUG 56400 / KCTC 2939 / LMG 18315 / NBRC 16415 / MH) TaxID=1219045 RepID=A0A086PBX3_SPHHM|nr:aldolase/citrate lyase family protein [Sphingobium herbicidovorans]KFG90891.1 Citrate lyase [Sphingobium herbicidovorans NBRC 16415]